MKKNDSGHRGSAAKIKSGHKDVDAYLAGVPEPARSTLRKIRAVIRSAVPPGTTEAISYRIPAFMYKGPLVWYAAFSDHCSLFPTASVIEAFKNKLKGFSTSKGTIHFPLDKPLSATLLRKLVKARIAQKEQKNSADRWRTGNPGAGVPRGSILVVIPSEARDLSSARCCNNGSPKRDSSAEIRHRNDSAQDYRWGEGSARTSA